MRLVKKPVLCNYYLTYRCNASCHFCDIWEKPSPYVNLENIQENLLQLKKIGVKVIDFTGGEPLLHRQLPEFLSLAKSLGFITTVTTNCLLYPKMAEKLKGKIDMLHFSLDSYDREEHDQARGVGCFDFVMQSIEKAKCIGEKPDIIFTAMNDNIKQLDAIYTNICEPDNLVLIINPVFGYNNIEDGGALSTDNLTMLSAFGKRKGVYLNEAFIQLRKDGGNHVQDPVCRAASTSLVISPFNELILPCYHLGKKHFKIEGKLEELYQSEQVQRLVALEGRLPECEGCSINCYMQPSFATSLNKYFWKALPSTIKYNKIKGTWRETIK